MKILITRDRKSAGGGIVSFIGSLDKFFTSEIRYVDIGRPFVFYGKENRVLRSTFFRLMADYVKLFLEIAFFRPDVVHINSSLDMSLKAIRRDGVNILIAKFFRRKVLIFWHGWYWKGAANFPYRGGDKGIMCGIYKMADAYMVLSARFKDDLVRWGFTKPVYVGTTTFDSSLSEGIPGAECGGGLGAGKFNVLFLSSVLREKGIMELVEAYKILKDRKVDCSLIIAGDGPYMNSVKERIAVLALADVYFTGYVDGPAKKDIYSKGNVFCFPSYDEAMPVTVLEAMAAGLPLVTSDVGALSEIIRDGEHGFVIHKAKARPDGYLFDPNEIADKIEELYKDPSLREKISKTNREYAAGKFHPGKVTENLETIYSAMVRG